LLLPSYPRSETRWDWHCSASFARLALPFLLFTYGVLRKLDAISLSTWVHDCTKTAIILSYKFNEVKVDGIVNLLKCEQSRKISWNVQYGRSFKPSSKWTCWSVSWVLLSALILEPVARDVYNHVLESELCFSSTFLWASSGRSTM